MKIEEALKALDPNNDEHWTQHGQPRIDAVQRLTGTEVTRKMISDAAPKFMRPAINPEPVHVQEPEVEPEIKMAEHTPAVKVDETEQLEAELKVLDKMCTESGANLEAARLQHAENSKRRDAILTKLTDKQPKSTLTGDIQAYLKTQQQARIDRAERMKKLEEMLGTRSPVERVAIDNYLTGRPRKPHPRIG